MRVKKARSALLDFARRAGVDVERITAEQAVRLMLDFYSNEPAENVHIQDGDMLLYQWGVYRFLPSPSPTFHFDLTRQFVVGDGEDDDISQLSLTLHYEPTAVLTAVASGNRWCRSRADVDELRQFISQSVAFGAVSTIAPVEVAIHFEAVG